MSHDEMQNTLNQLLVELDGFSGKDHIVVLGSTNIPDSLDPALLRPGRLDKIIDFHLPNIEEREEIISHYLKKIKL
jgi:cell division protease FtsH